MTPVAGVPALWQSPAAAAGRIVVRARDARGRIDMDAIEPASLAFTPPQRRADGSDADSIGAWPEKGIPGGQLGPNRNGRTW